MRSWKNLISFLIVLLCSLLLLEGSYRLYTLSFNPKVGPGVPSHIGQFDERLGWLLKPSSHGISTRTGYRVDYRINANGLRDDPTQYSKPEGVFRIVLLGDSRTFGFGVPIEKHFSTLLEGYFENLEVINMGVSGFGIDQELLYLRYEGFRYKPDLVLSYVAHYGNHRHLHTKRWGKLKPRFVLSDEGKLILTNTPVPRTGLPPEYVLRLDHLLAKHSMIYGDIIRPTIREIRKSDSAMVQREDDREKLQDRRFTKELYELGELLIREMHEESVKHGSIFVLVTEIGKLHKASIERGILSLDVSRALANQQFSLGDGLGHINEAGNGVLAWEIARFLEKNKLVPRRNRDRKE